MKVSSNYIFKMAALTVCSFSVDFSLQYARNTENIVRKGQNANCQFFPFSNNVFKGLFSTGSLKTWNHVGQG